MTFLSTSGTQLPRSDMVCRYVAKSFLDFAEALRSRPLSLVSVAKQSHRQQTDTAPLKHAAWFEGLTLCTRILPDRNTWTFSLPCLSESLVEMQSVAKSWTLSPHVKLQVVSIWKKWRPSHVSSLLLLLRPLHNRSNVTLQKGMKLLPSSIYWIYWLPFIPIPFGREPGFAFATMPRPKLATCLVKMLLLANHPNLKLCTPCPKQRTHVERQHCMRKILSVSLVSNLSGVLTCATMVWELIRVSQELLFLIACSAGSNMEEFVQCWKNVATGFGRLTGCWCHLLACQRPIRFALQEKCERMPRWWHGFWTSSVAMLMWGMEMADKNRKERGFLQRMVPRSAVVSQLPACGPSWTLSVGEVKFKKTQLVKHTHRRITPFSYHVYVGRRWSTKRILKHS